ncbi:hypothetical protein PNOK_0587000 [Pyrrhoderma noxium]|uniref:Uncharacterized protein n=1 Tax=Pyrrhoderma noxium TaxID=2282107 RepID=A0A286UHC5_9AGAM|nr:hypothetical protein PNOK_0587000 [Pyrrhoderma noxium]
MIQSPYFLVTGAAFSLSNHHGVLHSGGQDLYAGMRSVVMGFLSKWTLQFAWDPVSTYSLRHTPERLMQFGQMRCLYW